MEYIICFLSSLTELSAVIFKLIIFATSDYNYKAINIVFCLLDPAGNTAHSGQTAARSWLFEVLYFVMTLVISPCLGCDTIRNIEEDIFSAARGEERS